MAKKETQTAAPAIQTAEELEAKIRTMKEAQKKFASYTQEQVDKISSPLHGSQQDADSAGQDGGGRNRHGRCGR